MEGGGAWTPALKRAAPSPGAVGAAAAAEESVLSAARRRPRARFVSGWVVAAAVQLQALMFDSGLEPPRSEAKMANFSIFLRKKQII